MRGGEGARMLAAGTHLTWVDSSVNDPTGHAFVGSWETTSYSDPSSNQGNLDTFNKDVPNSFLTKLH
ncbi:hypothetical protein SUGI_0742750 [Cryptomeria japonica]|nr:hypothetical protein SUGI_0742750 [Cryptomeria japonica]